MGDWFRKEATYRKSRKTCLGSLRFLCPPSVVQFGPSNPDEIAALKIGQQQRAKSSIVNNSAANCLISLKFCTLLQSLFT